MLFKRGYTLFLLLILLVACSDKPLNNAHRPVKNNTKVAYSSFFERPKTLDPARSYSVEESIFTGQIYEPPLQYHYLKRPYVLIPLLALRMPQVKYYDSNNQLLPDNAPIKKIAYSIYDIYIKPGVLYQPHPAFAKDEQETYRYHNIPKKDLHRYYRINDFRYTNTREVTADDFVYQIKRLADPKVQSPIFGLMSNYIAGLEDLRKLLTKDYEALANLQNKAIDLRRVPFSGATVIDRYHYQVKIKGVYPQFMYWLAMPFFAPMPWEATVFYQQPGLIQHNISLDWFPIGTGAYQLTENNPNREMILSRNPNFRKELYPSEGEPGDKQKGLLEYAGTEIPSIDQYIFSLEPESIPRWTKFLQGYYDASTISSDNFDQTVHIDEQGKAELSQQMKDKKIRLRTSVEASTFYMGFNMLDNVVGGYSEKARKLRQAIAIALDYEEFISIFLNGRGVLAQGPVPPGIFSYKSGEPGINHAIFKWVAGRRKRLSIQIAKNLLAQAGYPEGRNIETGEPLILNFDAIGTSNPDDKAKFDWYRKQFAKLGIQLHIRVTSYNRFQQKMNSGDAQIFFWGWNADYPDPENFLFLLYGPNSKVKTGGENATNYENSEYDRLFDEMKNLPNGKERQLIIDKMLSIIQKDMPAIWALHPVSFVLSHAWNKVSKPSSMVNNGLKYAHIDTELRSQQQAQWNKPIKWPLVIFGIVLLLIIAPVIMDFWRRENKPRKRF